MELTITGLSVRPYTLPLDIETARGHFTERRGWHVDLRAGDALGHGEAVGRGDAAPWPGFGADAATVHAALEALSLVGARVPIATPEAIAAWVHHRQLPAPAACALEQALLDLAAARHDLPIAQWLAQPHALRPAAVVTHRLVDTPAAARAAVAQGFTTLKIKVARAPLAADTARVAAIRDAAPTAALRLDANGGWDRPTATAALAALGRHHPAWIEQPLPPEDHAGLLALRTRSAVPIAIDESLAHFGPAALDPALCDAVVIKPMFIGGLVPALALARAAHARGLMICITHALESPIGRRGALHLAAALGFGVHGVGDRPVEALPAAPGLGESVA